MPAQLLTAAMSIEELLTFRRRYLIPEYQRVYGWRETELQRLFGDIDNAISSRLGQGNGSGRFFLGTIYLATAKDQDQALVADGQQRLLTATMIYAVARDLSEDDAEAGRLHALLLTPGADATFRFSPRDRDAAFFRNWVQEPGATLRSLVQSSDPFAVVGAGSRPAPPGGSGPDDAIPL